MTAKTPKFDLDYLRTLVDFMKETEVDEVEVSENGGTIRLRRNMAPVANTTLQAAPAVQLPQIQEEAAPKIVGHVLKSPMVGTFYRSSSPETAPFVSIGDKVKKGQTLCIIEAMKTMNQVEADKDGIISDILTENASPVEFGQTLFVIN
ncbi:MAG: acetyl-CoA carboxylase biotin carboxyl carrier protein [Alphaproteobacteria bacterium]|jgi:acetyl-CoA carboxylase biotin carboxyl carrier protein